MTGKIGTDSGMKSLRSEVRSSFEKINKVDSTLSILVKKHKKIIL